MSFLKYIFLKGRLIARNFARNKQSRILIVDRNEELAK